MSNSSNNSSSRNGNNNQNIDSNIASNNYIAIKINDKEEYKYPVVEYGFTKVLCLPIKITVEYNSFLHIGASYDPRAVIKGQIFKVDRLPVIPATSFKGALRYQLEQYFIHKHDDLKNKFNCNDIKFLKPCIPTTAITKAEIELTKEVYRNQYINNSKYTTCYLSVDEGKINYPNDGICPVCYFMGAAGLPGFLRFTNFMTSERNSIIYQTNIRLCRKTNTAATGAKVEQEQVKGNTVFHGSIEIVIENPIDRLQGIMFGMPRIIKVNEENKQLELDKWLSNWGEGDKRKRIKTLIEEILIPSIQNIKELGGYKSRGAGRVTVEVWKPDCY